MNSSDRAEDDVWSVSQACVSFGCCGDAEGTTAVVPCGSHVLLRREKSRPTVLTTSQKQRGAKTRAQALTEPNSRSFSNSQ